MLYIFGSDEKLQAVLKNDGKTCLYWNPIHREALDSTPTNIFQFTIPADHPDSQYVTEGNLVAFRDLDQDWQLFEIKRTVDEHTDSLTRTAHCEHALYELCDDFIEDRRPTDVSAHFALTQALSGTRWSVGVVDDLGQNSTNFYYESALSAVQKVAAVWRGELRFRVVVSGGIISARYVDLLVRRGADTGKMFEYGRHTQEIHREVDRTTTVTALYGRGKGVEIEETGGYGRRLTFADVEWSVANGDPVDKPLGQEWVGDPDALAQWGRNGRHRFNTFDDSEETDPVVLLQKTWSSLQERKNPRATYTMKVLDLERVSGYAHEKVRLGDTVRCIDRKVSPPMFLAARVIEISRNITDPSDTEVILGNFAPTLADTAKTQQQINQTVLDRQGIWDSGGTPFVGPVPTDWLDGIIDVLTNQLKSTTSNWYTDENGNLVFETLDGTAAMRLTGNGFMLANEKDPINDEWVWRTFGTGDGFTADELNTGEIRTSLVKILGNTNFYWDGDYLYITNPDELNQQIRLSKEGIRFTRDGGTTWGVAMDFDGLRMEGKSQDGHTVYTGDGAKVYDENNNLVGHLGSFESLGSPVATFTRASTSYLSNGTLVGSGQPRFESGGVMIEEGTTNLLTANQASVETDTAGFTAVGATISRDTTEHWHGASALKVVTANAAANEGVFTNQTTVSASTVYTASAWVKAPLGVTLEFNLSDFIDSGTLVTFTGTGAWQRVNTTLTTDAHTSVYILIRTVSRQAVTFYLDGLQLEQKAVRSSWQLPGAARNAEVLTIPTSGILASGHWTVDLVFTPSSASVAEKFLWHCYIDANNEYRLTVGTDGKLYLSVHSAGAWYQVSGGNVASIGSTYYVTVCGDGSKLRLFCNGAQIGVGTTYTEPVGTLPANMYVGCYFLGLLQANGTVRDIRVSNHSRTLAEHQAYVASGPQYDDATTLLMTMDGTLLPTVRNYGLYTKNGRFMLENPAQGQGIELWDNGVQKVVIGRRADGTIGPTFRDGRLYSSEVRTGDEGALEYVALTPDNRFLVTYNGNKVLETFANSNQGHLRFYEAGAQNGRVYAASNTFRITAEDEGGTRKKLYMHGSDVEIRSNGQFDLYPGHEVTVQGDLFVTGNITKGGSVSYLESTLNYGNRLLYIVETPELKYYDSGVIQLLNGEATVEIDPIFLECIEPDTDLTPWQIWVDCYGENGVCVSEIGETYFKIKERNGGLSNNKVVWRLEATRKNYAGIRLMEVVR